MFRDQIFVISLDGSLLADTAIHNTLLDIAVLRSLNINVVLVHGIGRQMQDLAEAKNLPLSDSHGEGRTDPQTLEVAIEASVQTSFAVMQGLTKVGLRCMLSNAIRSTEVGIVKGVDQELSGRIDRIDLMAFTQLLANDCVPVVSPVTFNRDGESLRINSDLLAAALAKGLKASKLIFLTTQPTLQLDGHEVTNLTVTEVESLLGKSPEVFPERLLSKLKESVRAIHGGVPRAHILDGRIFGALLNEIFDKVGIGTMVYKNDYQSIRRAEKEDAQSIFNITRNPVKSEALRGQTLESIEASIDSYLIFEIDGGVVACMRMIPYNEGSIFELGSIFVQPFYQQRGIGRSMVTFALEEAKRMGAERVIAMSTQAIPFFTEVCGFGVGQLSDLPEARQSDYLANGRNSKILIKAL